MLLSLIACLPSFAEPQDTKPLLDPALLFASEMVDHRRSQSPVKDQGSRGTCAAFALTGALETFPGVPTDLCEQLLYATLKLHENDVDTWLRALGKDKQQWLLSAGNALADYVALFSVLGTCHESVWPYDPTPPKLDKTVPLEFREYLGLARITPEALAGLRDAAGKWGFAESDVDLLSPEETRDINRLKDELRSGTLAIPIGYAIHDRWFRPEDHAQTAPTSSAVGPGQRVILNPGLMEEFAPKSYVGTPRWFSYEEATETLRARDLSSRHSGDLVTELQKDRWISRPHSPPKTYGGHAVLIVGFTDDGFIIKNSWGRPWADNGYAIVSYDYHRLYAGAAAILRAATIRNPALNPFEATARIRQGAFRTKVQPVADTLVLSTWMEDPRDAPFEAVEYTIEHRPAPNADENGKGNKDAWQTFLTTTVSAGPTTARTGAPFTLDAASLTRLKKSPKARLRVRYGTGAASPRSHLKPLFHATRTFPTFNLSCPAAEDLIPAF